MAGKPDKGSVPVAEKPDKGSVPVAEKPDKGSVPVAGIEEEENEDTYNLKAQAGNRIGKL